MQVSDEQNTLRAATRLIDTARSQEQHEVPMNFCFFVFFCITLEPRVG